MKLIIKNAGTKGKGVFADYDIKENEIVFVFEGDVVKWPRATFRSLQIGRNKFINPGNKSFGAYFNHSCSPNCGIKDLKKIVAMRNIKKDEEITFDYSTTVGTKKWDMECFCNSKNCRKIIKPYNYLSAELKKQYDGWVSGYLLLS